MKAIAGQLANEKDKAIPEDVASWVASASHTIYSIVARLGYALKDIGKVEKLDVTRPAPAELGHETKLYAVTDGTGRLDGGKVTMDDSIGSMVHRSEVERGMKVGAHLGDLLLVYEVNGEKIAKLLTDDECPEQDGNVFYHGLMTSNEKKMLADAMQQYPTHWTDGNTSFDDCMESGVYPYVWKTSSSADAPTYREGLEGRIDLFVTRSTTADGNGYYGVIQTAVGREGVIAGMVWTRQLFVKGNGYRTIGKWSVGIVGGVISYEDNGQNVFVQGNTAVNIITKEGDGKITVDGNSVMFSSFGRDGGLNEDIELGYMFQDLHEVERMNVLSIIMIFYGTRSDEELLMEHDQEEPLTLMKILDWCNIRNKVDETDIRKTLLYRSWTIGDFADYICSVRRKR